MIWDGKRWALDDTQEVKRLARETVRSITSEADQLSVHDNDQYREITLWASKSEDIKRIDAMIQLASSEERIAIRYEGLDVKPMLLNVENGTIDLESGQLQPHDPANIPTSLAPVKFDPNADSPHWDQVLLQIFDDEPQFVAFWQRLFGYLITGGVRFHILVICDGSGRNGKSTILDTIATILGRDDSYSADPSLIMRRTRDD